jgi:phosphotransferase system HPr (HPr) family protein
VIARTFALQNPSGLHARPAALFVQIASRLRSDVTIQNLDRGAPAANDKSIIEVLTLGAVHGQRIEVRVNGEDEEAGLGQLAQAIESGLGESAA